MGEGGKVVSRERESKWLRVEERKKEKEEEEEDGRSSSSRET